MEHCTDRPSSYVSSILMQASLTNSSSLLPLTNLGPDRSSQWFNPDGDLPSHLIIESHGRGSAMTMYGIYHWVSLFLDESLSNGRIHRPGRPFTWTFEGEFHNVGLTEKSLHWVRSLQVCKTRDSLSAIVLWQSLEPGAKRCFVA